MELVYDSYVPSGVNELEANDSFGLLFPNPVKQGAPVSVSVKSDSKIDVKIFSQDGKLLSENPIQPIGGKIIIDTSKLVKGMYIVSLTQDGAKRSSKLLVR